MSKKINKLSLLCFFGIGVMFYGQQNAPYQGRVGINTNTPNATLNIVSKGNTSSTKALEIENSNNTRIVTVTDKGDMGIGIDTPNAKLDVNGNARVRDLSGTGDRPVYADTNGVLKIGTAVTPGASYTNSTSNIISGNQIQRAALTGDVTAAQNNNTVTVTRIQGKTISNAQPTNGQVLTWENNKWTPKTPASSGLEQGSSTMAIRKGFTPNGVIKEVQSTTAFTYTGEVYACGTPNTTEYNRTRFLNSASCTTGGFSPAATCSPSKTDSRIVAKCTDNSQINSEREGIYFINLSWISPN